MNSGVQNSIYFSVIIPTRNRAVLLKRCIQSVIDQKFEYWELIIIDDGSEDHTQEVVYDFGDPRIKYIFQEHQERSSARNRGIEEAGGKYVCFIDDDDTITEDYLSDFHNYYESHDIPEVILRTGFVRKIKDKVIRTTNYDHKKHKNPVNYAAYNMCGVWSLSIPKECLVEDRFPAEFPHWQDTHLILRLFMKYPLIQLPSYNYIYHIHPGMGSKKATLDFDPIERSELNVAAMEDLFNNVSPKIYDLVPKKTLNFLEAEKYIQYAVSSLSVNREKAKVIFYKSIKSGVYIRLYKSYILYIVYYIRKLF